MIELLTYYVIAGALIIGAIAHILPDCLYACTAEY